MTDTTGPTDLLRRAAAHVRETAQAATPGPWHMEDGPQSIYADNGTYVTSPWGDDTTDPDMNHIALWHPGVALAVAEWLESEYRNARMMRATVLPRHAEAVARALLNEPKEA